MGNGPTIIGKDKVVVILLKLTMVLLVTGAGPIIIALVAWSKSPTLGLIFASIGGISIIFYIVLLVRALITKDFSLFL